jgi:hypothetical protein
VHWYDGQTGEPRYETTYADGRPGKTPDLRDARKYGWAPGVTSVLGILDKPGLNNWKIDQAILAALTCPLASVPPSEALNVIKRDAEEQSKKAMQRGTDIHDAIEKFFLYEGARSCIPNQYYEHAKATDKCVFENTDSITWNVEAWLPGGLGYGGRCDLHNDEYLIDFKTKEFGPDDKVQGWPEQEVQLVAYDFGFGGPRRRLVNVFVSSTVPGLVHWYEWPEKGYDAAVKKWQATLACWWAWKNYYPLGEQK